MQELSRDMRKIGRFLLRQNASDSIIQLSLSVRRSMFLLKILSVVVLASLVVLWGLGSHLTAPKPSESTATPDNALEISFPSKSGSKIKGWLFEPSEAVAAVLLLHGKNASRSAMLDRAKRLYSLGYTALAIDFQAHGESSGDQVTLGLLESLDVDAAVAYLQQRFNNIPLIGLGVSQGGAALLLSSSLSQFKMLILESVYPDIETAVSNRLNSRIPFSGLLSPLLTMQLKIRLGKSASWFSPIRAAKNIRQPTLLLSGALDKHTTPDDTRAIYESLAGPKKMILIEEVGHDDLELFDSSVYWEHVEKFIASHAK